MSSNFDSIKKDTVFYNTVNELIIYWHVYKLILTIFIYEFCIIFNLVLTINNRLTLYL